MYKSTLHFFFEWMNEREARMKEEGWRAWAARNLEVEGAGAHAALSIKCTRVL